MKAGWQASSLGDLCNVIGGGTPAKDKAEFYSGDIPWATVRDMRSELITETEFRVTTAAVKNSSTNIIPGGNVVIATRVGLGKVCLLGQDTAINQDLRGIVPINPKVLGIRFLFWWLKSIADLIVAEGTGATVQGVKLPFVKGLQLPLPPLPEQQRIVTLLDEAFDGIAIAKANTEKNLLNARAIFESHLQSVFTQRGSAWLERSLGEAFKTVTGTTPPKNNFDFYGDFMPLAKPPELCGVPFNNAPDGLSEAGAKVARTLPAKSILVSCIGNLGKVGLNTVPVAFNQQINAILPDERLAIPKFMFFQALSPIFKNQLESLASGTTVPIVNKSKFNSVRIVLPPLLVQKTSVGQLESLSKETNHLESIYQQKLTALGELKKSLLHRAFTGQL